MRINTEEHKCPNCGGEDIETAGSVVVGVPTLDEKEIVIYAQCRLCKRDINVVCNNDRVVTKLELSAIECPQCGSTEIYPDLWIDACDQVVRCNHCKLKLLVNVGANNSVTLGPMI